MKIEVRFTVGGITETMPVDHDRISDEVATRAGELVDIDDPEADEKVQALMDGANAELTPSAVETLRASDDPEAALILESRGY